MGLDDPVIDIKVTPNRGDCLGVRGIARDLAAAGLGTLKPLAVKPVPGRFPCPVAVHLAGPDEKACPLFLGRLVRGVKNGPSPRLAARRGSRRSACARSRRSSISPISSPTISAGRSMSSMPRKLDGDLAVRGARAGEELAALNGKTYALDPAMTVIADNSGPLSLGGVIGGESTGCTEATNNVFIEAALFDPVRTAATGSASSISRPTRAIASSAASIPNSCGPASKSRRGSSSSSAAAKRARSANRAMCRTGGASCGFGPNACKRWAASRSKLRARTQSSNRSAVRSRDGAPWTVVPPSWRPDIEGEADLVEEVLRITGFEHIPAVPLARETPLPKPALDAGAAPRRIRAPHARRARARRGRDLLVPLRKRGAALRRRQRCVASRQSDQRRTRRRCGRHCSPISSPPRGRNADRGFADCALFEVGAAIPRRHARRTNPDGDGRARGRNRAEALGRSGPRGRRLSRQGRCRRRARVVRRCGGLAASGRRAAALVSPRPRRHLAARAEGLGGVRRDPPGDRGALRPEGRGRRLRGLPRRRTAAARAAAARARS